MRVYLGGFAAFSYAVVELSQRLADSTHRVGDARERGEDTGAAGGFPSRNFGSWYGFSMVSSMILLFLEVKNSI
jgi:hypothetical protein